MKRLILSTLMVTFVCGSSWSRASAVQGKYAAAGLEDDREVEQFFISFKNAVAKRDREQVAAMIAYPIRVRLPSGRRTIIKTRASLIRRYDAIFDAAFRKVIADTNVEDLWARWSGVAMPAGEIWFNGLSKGRHSEHYELKITAINGKVR
jgi:hypothetical protein